MKNKFNLRVVVLILCLPYLLVSTHVFAAKLDTIQREGAKKIAEAQKSQQKVDKIVDGAQERLIQYRSLLKQIEGSHFL